MLSASIAQLGERQTEDLKVPGSIPGGGILLYFYFLLFNSRSIILQNLCSSFLKILANKNKKYKSMPPPGIEPGTFRSSV